MGTIRFFLAFAVLISHANVCSINIVPAHVAVQAFFIISGFYMSLILNEKYRECGVYLYYSNRFFRLFPMYFVALVISFGVLWVQDVGIFTRLDKLRSALTHGAFSTVLYLWTNTAVIGQEILFLLGVNPETHSFFWVPQGGAAMKAWQHMLVPQAWSLSMELYFYLLAPFILRRNVCWICLFFVLSLGLRLSILWKHPEYDLLVRRCFPAELCLFLVGSLSYLLFTKIRESRNRDLLGVISWITLLAVLTYYEKIDGQYALGLLAFTGFICIPFVFSLTRDRRLDRFLGNISYPIYIVHFLIIALLEKHLEEYPLSLLVVLVLSVSVLLYGIVDVPVDRWRQSRVSGPSPGKWLFSITGPSLSAAKVVS